MRQVRIREHAPGHPEKTEKMLNDERHVEADDHEPERPSAQALREKSPAHLWKPVLKGPEDGEDDRAYGDEMKMGDEIIAVLRLPIEGHNRVADPGDSGAEELNEKRDAK